MNTQTIAPEGLTFGNPAQAPKGAVWGMDAYVTNSVPEGRALNASVFQEIVLSYRQSIIDKESPILILESHVLMMLFLIFDIVHNHLLVSYTIGNGCILMTPSMPMREPRVGFHPFASKCFDGLCVLCQGNSGRERYKDMHMVRHASDTVDFPVQAICMFQDDGIKLTFVVDIDRLLALECAKDDMIEGLYITHTNITEYGYRYCA